MMFPLTALCGLDLNARLFSIQAIDDAKYQRSEDSEPSVTKCKCRGGNASDDHARNRNLVRRNSGPA